jgi:hypothetical protein
MMLWALARLQLRPRKSLMQAALAATLRALPGASLLSITSILAALRRLEYLPPLPWMVEVCGAARAKVGSDASPTTWQRKDCVRRFEEAVTWFNEASSHAAAQAAGASPTSSIGSPTSSQDELDESSSDAGQQQQQRARQQRQKARMSMLAAANSSSEGLIAAAVGVAAAVAQQWHP